MTGRVFDIKEMTVHDGSGVRLTVFMKGCPLRCEWCHNPEGLKREKQLLYKKAKCRHCNLCLTPCSHPECAPYGRCLHICPYDCLSEVGVDYTPSILAQKIVSYKPIFDSIGGGVTFSGGEPLLQTQFIIETVKEARKSYPSLSVAIETCGSSDKQTFISLASVCDQVIMDIKVFDGERHKKYTGVYNDQIKENFLWLRNNHSNYLIRTPLIKGKTDDEENLIAIKNFIGDSKWEQIPENTLAKAKYDLLVD